MELKKNPSLDIHQKRGVIFNLALILSLAIILTAFEWKSYESDYQIDRSTSELWVELEIAKPALNPPKPNARATHRVEVEMMQIEFAYE